MADAVFTGSFNQADEFSGKPGALVFSFHVPNRHALPARVLEPAELAELERLLGKLYASSVGPAELMALMAQKDEA